MLKFDRLVAALSQATRNGDIPGWQASLWCDDGHFSDAGGQDGAGRSISESMLFNVWCLVRPMLSLQLVSALSRSNVPMNSSVGETLPGVLWPSLAAHSFSEIINHSIRVDSPDAAIFRMVDDVERYQMLEESVGRVREPAYAEVMTGYAMHAVLTGLLDGGTIAERIRREQLAGLEEHFVFPSELHAECDRLDGIGCYIANDGSRIWPLLHDKVPKFVQRTPDYLATYASATGLAAWYGRTLRRGGVFDAVGEALQTFRPTVMDGALQRRCGFRGGFMSELAAGHGFGSSVPPEAYGHLGWLGASFAFADPINRASVAVIVNHAAHPLQSAQLRMQLTHSVYSDH